MWGYTNAADADAALVPSVSKYIRSHDSDLAILSLLALSNSGGKSAGSPTQMAAASPQGGGPDSPGFPPRQLFNAGKGNGKRKRQDLASQGVAPSVSSPLSARKRPKADGTGGTPARTPGGRKTAKSLKFAPVAPPPPPDMTKMAQWKAMTEQFLHLAKLPKARQWCKFEHFYSSIDTAILKDPDQFQQLMRTHFPKISEIEQMTEFEWFYIRKKMQLKPRRFSRAFVHSELEKLERTRGHVRLLQHRVQPPENSGVELPPQIPQAYTIAKRVLARFPDKQGAVLPGTVYGVQATKATYRIEFDDPALGMQTVPDYDVIGTEPDVTISTETLMKERIVMPSAGISDQPAHKITPSIQALEKNRSAGTHQDQQVMSTGLLTTAFNTADGLATTDALITKIIVMANRYISISVKSTDPNVLQDTQPILLEIISRMLLVKKKLLVRATARPLPRVAVPSRLRRLIVDDRFPRRQFTVLMTPTWGCRGAPRVLSRRRKTCSTIKPSTTLQLPPRLTMDFCGSTGSSHPASACCPRRWPSALPSTRACSGD